MTGLVLRLLGYVLVVVGLRNFGGAFWRRYRERVVFALKVAGVLWLIMAVARYFMYDHPESQWTTLAIAVISLAVLYGAVWLAVRFLSRRRAGG